MYQVYIHIGVPFITYCSRLFVVVFQEMNCLHMMSFVGSLSYISPPSFMFVSVAVSEIRELNQNNKNSEISYFQFNTFPGHIMYPFFLTRGTF